MRKFLETEPAALVAAFLAVVQLLSTFGAPVPAGAAEATAVAIPAVTGAVLAVLTRPVKVAAIVAGLQTLITAIVAWGVDFPAGIDPQAILVDLSLIASSALALLVRMGVIPAGAVEPIDKQVVSRTT